MQKHSKLKYTSHFIKISSNIIMCWKTSIDQWHMDFDFTFMMVLKGYILGLFLACGLPNTIN
jgi:hypothetical protein